MKYVVLEGVDNCGKSTIAKELNKRLSNSVVIQEPSKEGKLRDIILNDKINDYTRQLLLIASRNETLLRQVYPYKYTDKIIISDRNYLSQLVYCDYKSFDMVFELNRQFMREYKPDITFIIDVPNDILLERANNSQELNKLDSLEYDIINSRVMRYSDMGSLLAEKYDHYIFHIDGTQSIKDIVDFMVEYIDNIREKI